MGAYRRRVAETLARFDGFVQCGAWIFCNEFSWLYLRMPRKCTRTLRILADSKLTGIATHIHSRAKSLLQLAFVCDSFAYPCTKVRYENRSGADLLRFRER